MDLSENCPEADPGGVLLGADLGFHSGTNHWQGGVVPYDDANALTWENDGNNIFELTINTMDYYGMAFGDVENIRMVGNNAIQDPASPWDIFAKDSVNAEAFGSIDVCSDLILHFDQMMTCADLAQESSLILFSDAGDSESCVDLEDGLVRVDLDYGLACPEGDAGGLLAGASTIGFHSGANMWTNIIAWDDPTAVQLVNDGNDNFSVVIDAAEYYGVPFDEIVDIQLLGNNGPNDDAAPWDAKLEDPTDGGDFGSPTPCSNINFVIAEAPTCDLSLNSTVDLQLQHSFKAAPNPFTNRTFVNFDNPNNATFTLVITNYMGQTMRTMTGITGERVLVEREDLPTGIYVANLIDENGNFATTKLVVK